MMTLRMLDLCLKVHAQVSVVQKVLVYVLCRWPLVWDHVLTDVQAQEPVRPQDLETPRRHHQALCVV